MKSVRKTMLLSALLTCGIGVATAASAAPADQNVAPGAGTNQSMHHRGGPGHTMAGAAMPGSMMGGPFFQAIHRLNLTTEQQATIRGFLETAREHNKAAAPSQPSVDVLANPGDPNYVAAIATAKKVATARIQQHSELQVQIYGQLTPDQQAKLPQVLAEMKAEHERHRADRQQHLQQRREPAATTK